MSQNGSKATLLLCDVLINSLQFIILQYIASVGIQVANKCCVKTPTASFKDIVIGLLLQKMQDLPILLDS